MKEKEEHPDYIINLGESINYIERMKVILKQALWELEHNRANIYTNAAIANILKELDDLKKETK